ncbi:uncharacterized protein [Procambarus clarkii]|uniref:uncharacterized protein isoform X3 n=1 Tax=Procambarus clarkii TaxID=6728 RepID=UPI003742601A
MKPSKLTFSEHEKTLLFSLISREKQVLECRDNKAQSLEEKRETWEVVTARFNSEATVARTVEELKRCWMNQKYRERYHERVKMMTKFCCMPNCDSCSRTARLFRFPKQPKMALKWRQIIVQDKIKSFYITKNKFVCEHHFRDTDFRPLEPGNLFRALKPHAVPKISRKSQLKKKTFSTPFDTDEVVERTGQGMGSSSTSQSLPSTSQLLPSTSQSLPSTSQSLPSPSQSLPSTSQSLPSTSQRYNESRKPPYVYWQLCVQAIANAPNKQRTARGIHDYIMKHYPYFIKNNNFLRSTVCPTLYCNKCFVKVPETRNEEGLCLWKIDPALECELVRKAFKPKQSMLRTQKKHQLYSMKMKISDRKSSISKLALQDEPSAFEYVSCSEKSANDGPATVDGMDDEVDGLADIDALAADVDGLEDIDALAADVDGLDDINALAADVDGPAVASTTTFSTSRAPSLPPPHQHLQGKAGKYKKCHVNFTGKYRKYRQRGGQVVERTGQGMGSSSTSQPLPSTSQPLPSTSQPLPSTSQSLSSTSQPLPSTSQPLSSTSQPLSSTSQPLPSTSQPLPSTSQPLSSTSESLPSSSQHYNESSGPEAQCLSKPPYVIWQLCVQAIANAPNRQSTAKDIHDYIVKHYPYFNLNNHLWEKTVRPALCCYKFFVKVPKMKDEEGVTLWKIDPALECELIRKALVPKQLQKKRRKKHLLYSMKMKFSSRKSTISKLALQDEPSAIEYVSCSEKSANDGPATVDGMDDEVDGLADTDALAADVDGLDNIDALAADIDGPAATSTTTFSTSRAPSLPPPHQHLQGKAGKYKECRANVTRKYRKYRQRGDQNESRGPKAQRLSRPSYVSWQLCAQAIANAPNRQSTAKGIHDYIMKHYPYFKINYNLWKNSLRPVLSCYDYFVKVRNTKDEEGLTFWKIDPALECELIEKAFKPSQFLMRSRKKHLLSNMKMKFSSRFKKSANDGPANVDGTADEADELADTDGLAADVGHDDIGALAADVDGPAVASTTAFSTSRAPSLTPPRQHLQGKDVKYKKCRDNVTGKYRKYRQRGGQVVEKTGQGMGRSSTSQSLPSMSQLLPSTSQSLPSTSQPLPSSSQSLPSTSQRYNESRGPKAQCHSKPPYVAWQLCVQAIANAPNRQSTAKGVHDYIMKHYPYFNSNNNLWKNIVSPTLYYKKYFVKVRNTKDEKGLTLWKIDPALECELIEKAFKPSQFLMRRRKKHLLSNMKMKFSSRKSSISKLALQDESSAFESVSCSEKSANDGPADVNALVADVDGPAVASTTTFSTSRAPSLTPPHQHLQGKAGKYKECRDNVTGKYVMDGQSDGQNESRGPEARCFSRPPYRAWQLCVQAIANALNRQSTVKDIHDYVMKHYPYFMSNNLWKNTVRRALYCSKYFVKIPETKNEEGTCLWKIDPALECELLRKAFKPKQSLLKNQNKHLLSNMKMKFSSRKSSISKLALQDESSAVEYVSCSEKSANDGPANVDGTADEVDELADTDALAADVDGPAVASTTAFSTSRAPSLTPPHQHLQGKAGKYKKCRDNFTRKYVKYRQRGDQDSSPNAFSFKQLIIQAISSSEEKQLCLKDILAYIMEHNPHFHPENKLWQNSVEANLRYRRHFSFTKQGRKIFWKLVPKHENTLIAQAYIPHNREQKRSLKIGYTHNVKRLKLTVAEASQDGSPKLEGVNVAAPSLTRHPSASSVGTVSGASNTHTAPLSQIYDQDTTLAGTSEAVAGTVGTDTTLAGTSEAATGDPSVIISDLLSKSCSVRLRKLDDAEMLEGVNWFHKRKINKPLSYLKYEDDDVHTDSESNTCDDLVVVKEELMEAQDKASKDHGDYSHFHSVADSNYLLQNTIQGNSTLERDPLEVKESPCSVSSVFTIPNSDDFGNITEENACIEIDNSDNNWLGQRTNGGIAGTIDEGCVNNESDGSTCSRDSAAFVSNDGDQHLDNSCIRYETFASRRFPSDKAHFTEPLNTQEKQFVILKGPCQPPGPFPFISKEDKQSFSESHYTMINRAGMKLMRAWLCYSAALDCAYCQACWLFSTTNREDAWVKGVRDWGHISAEIEKHENLTSHLQCCIIQEQWRLNKTLTEEVEKAMRKEALFWRQVLERIINTTLTLFTSNLSCGSHKEPEGKSDSPGNSLAIISLLSKYDPVLNKLLSMPDATVTYLTQTIPNELIGMISKSIREDIIKDVDAVPFFSVIMDSTQDLGKTDQLSQVVRYVSVRTDQNGKPVEIQIKESFLGFVQNNTQSGAGLNISKLRGQAYDGAACMSEAYEGLQAELNALQPKAAYVHCAAHNLNLVLKDAMSDVLEVHNFFGIVENIYYFFASSLSRWNKLCLFLPNSSINLSKMCPKKWSSWYDTLLALRYRLADILKLLSNIILLGKTKDDVSEATALKSKIEQFEFVFLTVLLTKILDSIGCVSLLLSSSQCDLSKAAELFQMSCAALQETRSQYDSIRKTSVEIAKTWGISDCFEERQAPSVKKFSVGLCDDKRTISSEKRFKVNVFYPTLDIACVQTKQRSESLTRVVTTFKALHPSVLMSATDSELLAAGDILANQYNTDLSSFLPFQLLSFRSCIKQELAKMSTIQEIASLLMVEKYFLSSSFPDIYTACMLFLTLPVTVAPCENSVSKLDQIKNYLRNTAFTEQLDDLALLSIEKEWAKKVNVSKIIDIYTDASARKTLRQ